jgi:hypothetical protein
MCNPLSIPWRTIALGCSAVEIIAKVVRMRTLLLVSVLFLAETLCHASRAPAVEKSNTGTSALMVLTGNDSKIVKPAYQRVRSAAEWKRTWLSHLGFKSDTIYRPAMEVDFNRCMVIAVFGGKYVNSCGYRIESVIENKISILIRFDDISYGTAGGADRVTPYAFVVLPKTDKPVVLEKNMQRYKGEPPEWKEVARLSKS